MPGWTQGVSFGGGALRTVESSCRPERRASRGALPAAARTGLRAAQTAASCPARPAATSRSAPRATGRRAAGRSGPRCPRCRGGGRTAIATDTRASTSPVVSSAALSRSVSARACTTSVDRSLPATPRSPTTAPVSGNGASARPATSAAASTAATAWTARRAGSRTSCIASGTSASRPERREQRAEAEDETLTWATPRQRQPGDGDRRPRDRGALRHVAERERRSEERNRQPGAGAPRPQSAAGQGEHRDQTGRPERQQCRRRHRSPGHRAPHPQDARTGAPARSDACSGLLRRLDAGAVRASRGRATTNASRSSSASCPAVGRRSGVDRERAIDAASKRAGRSAASWPVALRRPRSPSPPAAWALPRTGVARPAPPTASRRPPTRRSVSTPRRPSGARARCRPASRGHRRSP